ncbi:M48 family metalloprotease [Motiliproteus sediminis]|uniref:M48 family metalloprotease n=1 Tax=Motiliproteus sediminis TaxID=1468178 RepID=UPI001AEF679D|nr:M48 family metalloprotease [Motiliproteus sediminis]
MTKFKPLVVAMLIGSATPAQTDTSLPILGDSASSVVSLDEEYRIGRAWVRILRAQAPLLDDPQIYSYIEALLYRLAGHSQLPDRRLSLVLMDNSSLNAFAAPGGVVGINAGLFLYAASEAEFASVVAHELSHLSQRHYAMGLQEQQRNAPWQLASMLASILVMAAADGQAGAAAMMSSQAAFAQKGLAFSRANEQEADRIGMQVLVDAGYDPRAMPEMFAQMQRSTAYLGQRAPEFLLTHPVTESRIADALNRSAQLPTDGLRNSMEYQLIQTRVKVQMARNANEAFKQFRDAVLNSPSPSNYYGLAFSALKSGHYDDAQNALDKLQQEDPNRLSYQLLAAEISLSSGDAQHASALLRDILALYPDNHSAVRLLAQALVKAQQYDEATRVMREHTRSYPDDLQLWYELAEAYGLAGNRLGLHQARAEYFLLRGAVPQAELQLNQALKIEDLNPGDRARIERRLAEAQQIRKDMEF